MPDPHFLQGPFVSLLTNNLLLLLGTLHLLVLAFKLLSFHFLKVEIDVIKLGEVGIE